MNTPTSNIPSPPKPTFKFGSTTHIVLSYAYVYDKALTLDDFQRLSKNSFRDKGEIKKSLLVLVSNKSVAPLNDTHWRITPLGVRQVIELAKENNVEVPGIKKKYPLKPL